MMFISPQTTYDVKRFHEKAWDCQTKQAMQRIVVTQLVLGRWEFTEYETFGVRLSIKTKVSNFVFIVRFFN